MFGKIVGIAAVLCVAAAAQAVYYGTIDFETGSQAPLTKDILLQDPTAWVVGSFGGQGSYSLNGKSAGRFGEDWLLVNTTGSGDVYGDVKVSALYKPSNQYECPVGLRVQANGTGYGLWASVGTNGWGTLGIAYQSTNFAAMDLKAQNGLWTNGDSIVTDLNKWYAVSLTAQGQTLTGSLTELDANWNAVAGHTAFVNYTSADVPLTGMVGSRSACGAASPGYFVDNFAVAAVPEPVTLTLLALGGLALIRRR